MSLTTLALVNGILVAALLAALAYVCRLPFRLDRPDSSANTLASEPDREYEELAA